MADLSSAGQGDEPANKRARLESVIPIPVAAGKKDTAKNKQPGPPPPPRPCPPPYGCWVNFRWPSAEGAMEGAQARPTEVGSLPEAASPGQAAATGVPTGAAAVLSKAANMAAGAAGEGINPERSIL
jgi:hypothetical protein